MEASKRELSIFSFYAFDKICFCVFGVFLRIFLFKATPHVCDPPSP